MFPIYSQIHRLRIRYSKYQFIIHSTPKCKNVFDFLEELETFENKTVQMFILYCVQITQFIFCNLCNLLNFCIFYILYILYMYILYILEPYESCDSNHPNHSTHPSHPNHSNHTKNMRNIIRNILGNHSNHMWIIARRRALRQLASAPSNQNIQ